MFWNRLCNNTVQQNTSNSICPTVQQFSFMSEKLSKQISLLIVKKFFHACETVRKFLKYVKTSYHAWKTYLNWCKRNRQEISFMFEKFFHVWDIVFKMNYIWIKRDRQEISFKCGKLHSAFYHECDTVRKFLSCVRN